MSFRKFVDRAENRNRADANRVNTYLRPVGIRNGLPDQVRANRDNIQILFDNSGGGGGGGSGVSGEFEDISVNNINPHTGDTININGDIDASSNTITANSMNTDLLNGRKIVTDGNSVYFIIGPSGGDFSGSFIHQHFVGYSIGDVSRVGITFGIAETSDSITDISNVSILPAVNGAGDANLGSADNIWDNLYVKYINLSGGIESSITGNNKIVLDPTSGSSDNSGIVHIKGDLVVDGSLVRIVDIEMSGNIFTINTDNDDERAGIEVKHLDGSAFFVYEPSTNTWTTSGEKLSVGDLTVDGTLALNDVSLATLDVSENLTVQGVTTLSGDVTVTNGLTVNGTLALNDVSLATLDVSENLTVQGVTTLSGDVTVTNGLTVNGTLALNDVSLATLDVSENLTVQGVTTLSGDVTVTNGLTVGGTLALNDVSLATLDVSENLTVQGVTTLSGDVTVTNGLTVGGTLALHDVSLATLDVSNNLTVAGTSTLTGAVTMADKLDVSGVDVSNNLTVAGTSTLTGAVAMADSLDVSGVDVSNNLTVAGTSTLTGAVTMADKLYVSGVDVSNNLTVSGLTILKGVSMEDLSTGTLYVANNLTVDGKINASELSFEDISLGTVDVSNNLTVAGTSTLTGAVTMADSLDVSGVDVSNNLTVAGTSTLTGAVTMADSLDVSGVDVSNNLTVAGTSTLTGAVTMADSLDVSGVDVSNNLTVSGTSTLTGAVTMADSLDVSGVDVSNNLTVAGTSTLTGAVFMTDGLQVSTVYVSDNLTVAGTSTLTGAVTMADSLDVSGVDVSNNLTVAGTSTLTGAVTMADSLDVSSVDVSNNLTVAGTSTLTGAVFMTDGLQVSSVYVSDNLTIAGTSTLTGAVTMADKLDVSGVDVSNNLTVAGTSTLTGAVTMADSLDVSSVDVSNNLTVAGTSTLTGAVTMADSLDVSSVDVSNNLTVAGTSTLTGAVTMADSLDVSGVDVSNNLTVAGTSTLSGLVTIDNSLNVSREISANSIASILKTSRGVSEINSEGDVSYNERQIASQYIRVDDLASDVSHTLNGDEFIKVLTEDNQTLRLTILNEDDNYKIIFRDASSSTRTRLNGQTNWGDVSSSLELANNTSLDLLAVKDPSTAFPNAPIDIIVLGKQSINPLPITKRTPTAAPQDLSMSIITNERVNIFGTESLFFRFTEDENPTTNALDNVVRKGTKIVYRIQDTCNITLYGNQFNNIFTHVEVDTDAILTATAGQLNTLQVTGSGGIIVTDISAKLDANLSGIATSGTNIVDFIDNITFTGTLPGADTIITALNSDSILITLSNSTMFNASNTYTLSGDISVNTIGSTITANDISGLNGSNLFITKLESTTDLSGIDMHTDSLFTVLVEDTMTFTGHLESTNGINPTVTISNNVVFTASADLIDNLIISGAGTVVVTDVSSASDLSSITTTGGNVVEFSFNTFDKFLPKADTTLASSDGTRRDISLTDPSVMASGFTYTLSGDIDLSIPEAGITGKDISGASGSTLTVTDLSSTTDLSSVDMHVDSSFTAVVDVSMTFTGHLISTNGGINPDISLQPDVDFTVSAELIDGVSVIGGSTNQFIVDDLQSTTDLSSVNMALDSSFTAIVDTSMTFTGHLLSTAGDINPDISLQPDVHFTVSAELITGVPVIGGSTNQFIVNELQSTTDLSSVNMALDSSFTVFVDQSMTFIGHLETNEGRQADVTIESGVVFTASADLIDNLTIDGSGAVIVTDVSSASDLSSITTTGGNVVEFSFNTFDKFLPKADTTLASSDGTRRDISLTDPSVMATDFTYTLSGDIDLSIPEAGITGKDISGASGSTLTVTDLSSTTDLSSVDMHVDSSFTAIVDVSMTFTGHLISTNGINPDISLQPDVDFTVSAELIDGVSVIGGSTNQFIVDDLQSTTDLSSVNMALDSSFTAIVDTSMTFTGHLISTAGGINPDISLQPDVDFTVSAELITGVPVIGGSTNQFIVNDLSSTTDLSSVNMHVDSSFTAIVDVSMTFTGHLISTAGDINPDISLQPDVDFTVSAELITGVPVIGGPTNQLIVDDLSSTTDLSSVNMHVDSSFTAIVDQSMTFTGHLISTAGDINPDISLQPDVDFTVSAELITGVSILGGSTNQLTVNDISSTTDLSSVNMATDSSFTAVVDTSMTFTGNLFVTSGINPDISLQSGVHFTASADLINGLDILGGTDTNLIVNELTETCDLSGINKQGDGTFIVVVDTSIAFTGVLKPNSDNAISPDLSINSGVELTVSAELIDALSISGGSNSVLIVNDLSSTTDLSSVNMHVDSSFTAVVDTSMTFTGHLISTAGDINPDISLQPDVHFTVSAELITGVPVIGGSTNQFIVNELQSTTDLSSVNMALDSSFTAVVDQSMTFTGHLISTTDGINPDISLQPDVHFTVSAELITGVSLIGGSTNQFTVNDLQSTTDLSSVNMAIDSSFTAVVDASMTFTGHLISTNGGINPDISLQPDVDFTVSAELITGVSVIGGSTNQLIVDDLSSTTDLSSVNMHVDSSFTAVVDTSMTFTGHLISTAGDINPDISLQPDVDFTVSAELITGVPVIGGTTNQFIVNDLSSTTDLSSVNMHLDSSFTVFVDQSMTFIGHLETNEGRQPDVTIESGVIFTASADLIDNLTISGAGAVVVTDVSSASDLSSITTTGGNIVEFSFNTFDKFLPKANTTLASSDGTRRDISLTDPSVMATDFTYTLSGDIDLSIPEAGITGKDISGASGSTLTVTDLSSTTDLSSVDMHVDSSFTAIVDVSMTFTGHLISTAGGINPDISLQPDVDFTVSAELIDGVSVIGGSTNQFIVDDLQSTTDLSSVNMALDSSFTAIVDTSMTFTGHLLSTAGDINPDISLQNGVHFTASADLIDGLNILGGTDTKLIINELTETCDLSGINKQGDGTFIVVVDNSITFIGTLTSNVGGITPDLSINSGAELTISAELIDTLTISGGSNSGLIITDLSSTSDLSSIYMPTDSSFTGIVDQSMTFVGHLISTVGGRNPDISLQPDVDFTVSAELITGVPVLGGDASNVLIVNNLSSTTDLSSVNMTTDSSFNVFVDTSMTFTGHLVTTTSGINPVLHLNNDVTFRVTGDKIDSLSVLDTSNATLRVTDIATNSYDFSAINLDGTNSTLKYETSSTTANADLRGINFRPIAPTSPIINFFTNNIDGVNARQITGFTSDTQASTSSLNIYMLDTSNAELGNLRYGSTTRYFFNQDLSFNGTLRGLTTAHRYIINPENDSGGITIDVDISATLEFLNYGSVLDTTRKAGQGQIEMSVPNSENNMKLNFKFFDANNVTITDVSNFSRYEITDSSLIDLSNNRFGNISDTQLFELVMAPGTFEDIDVSFTDLAGEAIIPA